MCVTRYEILAGERPLKHLDQGESLQFKYKYNIDTLIQDSSCHVAGPSASRARPRANSPLSAKFVRNGRGQKITHARVACPGQSPRPPRREQCPGKKAKFARPKHRQKLTRAQVLARPKPNCQPDMKILISLNAAGQVVRDILRARHQD